MLGPSLSLRLMDCFPGTHVCLRARSRSPDLHRHHERALAMGTAGIASSPMTCGGGGRGERSVCSPPLTVTHWSATVLGPPSLLPPLSGVAHISPSDVALSSISVPVAVASVGSESSNSSSSSSSSSPSSSLVSTWTPLRPCICKRTGAIIGDVGEGKPNIEEDGSGGDWGCDKPEDDCELMYISGLGMVTSERKARRALFLSSR
ncbi:hypothetical protein DFH94DRAFT_214784 [Russula ochroleuca]|uniref:Uncharacterized protein n=1 Tax=Russula ochroleuca TaxID=152965 RepID=A0A9P5MPP7_9AGAM|nr:hypothetical protein DFH94DRAFT_214784 [Russula ochroleuca]